MAAPTRGFKSLLRSQTGDRHNVHRQFVNGIFPTMVQESGLQYWRPEQGVPQTGRRILLCIAPWSIYDLSFLDELIRAMRIGHTTHAVIEVFNTDDADTLEALMLYYPVFPEFPVWPFAGLWVDGVFQSLTAGHLAKDFIRGELDMPPPPPGRERWCDYYPI